MPLTLEMVTEEERLYMYRMYARDPEARVNLGIRRRLAPLMHNDRRRVALMNMLLFSLSGTPVIYYGDELGMGDNIYLGDRDGVRTPTVERGSQCRVLAGASPAALSPAHRRSRVPSATVHRVPRIRRWNGGPVIVWAMTGPPRSQRPMHSYPCR